MDHEWGRNVTRYGLGNAGASLAACFLAAPSLILTNGRDTADPSLALVWNLPDTGTPFYTVGGIDVTGLGNFPFGFSVEADGPL